MPEAIHSLNCPCCGAPLPSTDQRHIVCQYCKATLKLPEASPNTPQQVIVVTTNLPPKVKASSPPLWKLWLLGLVIISIIGGCLAIGILFSTNNKDAWVPKLNVWSLDHPILIPNEPYNGLTSLVSFSDSSHRLAYFDFNQANALQWKSENLEQPTYRMTLQAAAGRIYLADETRLIAFQQSDGAQLWQATLNDLLPTSCRTCLQANAERVIALTQLNTLQAFDAATGQSLWSAGLAQQPQGTYLLNDRLVYIDEVNQTEHIQIVDTRTGKIEHSLEPTCPNHSFTNDVQTPESDDPLIPASDQQSIYLLYGFWEPACLEKWDVQTGQRLWQTTLPEDLARNQAHFVQTSDQLFLSAKNGNEVWRIDVSSGQASQIFQADGYQLRPIAARDDKLVIQAERTLGSKRYELWTIHAQTGKKLWQTIPNGTPIEPGSSETINGQNKFAAFLTPGGLTVLQAFAEPQRIVFETFNLETGNSSGQMTYAVPEQNIFSVTLLGWQKNYVYLAQTKLNIFDVNTGQPIVQWP